jgi:hypothetical protein
MTIELISPVFDQFGVRLAARAEGAVGTGVLMAHGDLGVPKIIRNALAPRAYWLVRGAWVVLVRFSSFGALLQNGPLVPDILEHL